MRSEGQAWQGKWLYRRRHNRPIRLWSRNLRDCCPVRSCFLVEPLHNRRRSSSQRVQEAVEGAEVVEAAEVVAEVVTLHQAALIHDPPE